MNSSVFIDGSPRIHDVIALTTNDVMKVSTTRVPIEGLEREFIISGSGATEFLNEITINDVTKINEWQAQYSAMCYDDGRIIDDILVYK